MGSDRIKRQSPQRMSKHAILLLAGVVAVFLWVHNIPYQLSMTTVVPILSRSSTSEQDNLRNYPIVVGGLGDSGTRAVRSTLINLGVEMLPNRWVMSTSTDSILFINNMDNGRWRMRERQTGHKEKADIFETNSDGISVLEPDEAVRAAMHDSGFPYDGHGLSPGFYYMRGIYNGSSLVYDSNSLGDKLWQSGVEYVKRVVQNHRIASSAHMSEAGGINKALESQPWGFKHPRTALMLPLYHAALGDKWKFVHVIRDGRDLAAGDNTKMHDQLCCIFYGIPTPWKHWACSDPRCDQSRKGGNAASSFAAKYQFWQDSNAELVRWGAKHLGIEERYFPIRIEDFVLKRDRGCLARLAKFLEIPDYDLTTAERVIWSSFDGHEGSYGGAKYSQQARERMAQFLESDAHLPLDYISNMGYYPTQFGINVGCEEWLDNLKRDVQHNEVPIDNLHAIVRQFRGNGPIIVGGIGDSGTRGVVDILSRFGVNMGAPEDVKPGSKDSMIWQKTKSKRGKLAAHLYNHGVVQGTVGYDVSAMSIEDRIIGADFLTRVIKRIWGAHVSSIPKTSHLSTSLWGFKHPRTALALPWFDYYLGKEFKFLHVLRDPKDVINGNNKQLMLKGATCALYYGKPCVPSKQMHLKFWLDVNNDIADWAASKLSPSQYLALRIEDVVYADECLIQKLASFLGVKVPPSKIELDRAFEPYRKSYRGGKYQGHERSRVLSEFASLDRANEVQKFGYSKNSFDVSTCKDFYSK